MIESGGKEVRTVLFLVILQVFRAYLHCYFKVKVICKLAFEERTCKIIVNKFISFLSNL